MPIRHPEDGSALVEAAIIFPVLILILYWSSALTDVLVLKLKAAEAVRYALWETTVFKAPAQIQDEVARKYLDLRSPRDVQVAGTGLLLFPSLPQPGFRVDLDTTSQKVSIGREMNPPQPDGVFGSFLDIVFGAMAGTIDAEMARERFNVHGKASARVSLEPGKPQGSHLLAGGDVIGVGDGRQPSPLAKMALQAPLPSERPMQLVFDTWKAWPKPAEYTRDGAPTDVSVSPMRTYPVVEEQVSAQVDKMVFFGLNQAWWFDKMRTLGRTVGAAVGPIAGGSLPDVFSAARMDGPERGPITILPPEPADTGWAPSECDVQGHDEPCATQRLGDLRTARAGPAFLDDTETLGSRVDRTRYTLPFRINTQYWQQSGGTNAGDGTGGDRKLQAPPQALTADNEYVKTYHCRGHFFAGSQRAQEADPARRYAKECSQ
jgi:hypothetical protein